MRMVMVESLVGLLAFAVLAQAQTAGVKTGQAADLRWPRQFTDGKASLLVYQPQVDSWQDFSKLVARFAVALTPARGGQAVYGAMLVESDSLVDLNTRMVHIANFRLRDLRYSSAPDEQTAQQWENLTERLLPRKAMAVGLDQIKACMQSSPVIARQVEVSFDPPPILVSMQPAVLLMIDGGPIPLDVEKTSLQKILNTNWDLFFDKKSLRYYLRHSNSWLSAPGLADAWSAAGKLPTDFLNLPATSQYAEARRAAAAPQPIKELPAVFLANKPTELIVIEGEPAYELIGGTELMSVYNTESDLFFDMNDRSYYFLTSGRWFRTADLRSGKWESATTNLPADFKRIPPDNSRSHVRASVPGTQEAEEAVFEASIPRTVTLSRKSLQFEVQYVGDPEFQEIEGTGVSFATNTPTDVVHVGGLYYLCLDGAWFVSGRPNGPWEVADRVPQEIYSIPPNSPKYNTTYVKLYESTPTTVTYGYTPGYTGVYVSKGVTVWGTGYYYPAYYVVGVYPQNVYWPPPHYSYGISAWYNPVTRTFARGSAVYGPYGGYGRAAAYNPKTGRYSWGETAYGRYGSVAQGASYNPRSGVWGSAYQAGGRYQSWGRSVVARGDDWVRSASYENSRGEVRRSQTSGGGGAIVVAGRESQGFVARSASGDIYAGKDGNVYKREGGEWYRNSGNGSWDSLQKQAPASARREEASSAFGGSVTHQQLDTEAVARERGNYNTQRSTSLGQSTVGGGSGWTLRSENQLSGGRGRRRR